METVRVFFFSCHCINIHAGQLNKHTDEVHGQILILIDLIVHYKKIYLKAINTLLLRGNY